MNHSYGKALCKDKSIYFLWMRLQCQTFETVIKSEVKAAFFFFACIFVCFVIHLSFCFLLLTLRKT